MAHTPFVINFRNVLPLSAVLGTNVLWVQGSYTDRQPTEYIVPNTADRASGVGKRFPKLMTKGGGGGCLCFYTVYIFFAINYLVARTALS